MVVTNHLPAGMILQVWTTRFINYLGRIIAEIDTTYMYSKTKRQKAKV